MSSTFTPPSETLPSRQQAVSVAAQNAIQEIRAEYDVESIYTAAGGFVAPYLGSSISTDKKSATIARTGGWERPFGLRVDDGSAPVVVPQLMPNSYGALAQWSLGQVSIGNLDPSDRSGNGYTLALQNYSVRRSNKPGRVAYSPSDYNGSPRSLSPGSQLPITLGEMAVACVIYPGVQASNNAWIFSVGDYNTASPAGNTTFSLLLCNATYPNPVYYVRNGTSTEVVWPATSLWLPDDGCEHFICCSRDADGYVTIGLDGVYQTSTSPVTTPTGGGSGVTQIGGHAGDGVGLFRGAIDDMNVWHTHRTNAEFEALRAIAMGLS